jgi:hypothetical protein
MRTRFFFLAASVTSIAAAAVAQGCGDTETTTTPGDAGADVAAPGPKRDSAPPAEDAEPPCDTTKDFAADIPDAEIADGASTTGLCVGCAQANCKSFIDDCNENCQCQELAGDALECYAKTANIIGCVGQFATAKVTKETQSTALGLFSCINDECKDECQTEQFADGGADGGIKDAANDG